MIHLGGVDSPQKNRKPSALNQKPPLKQLKKVYSQLIKEEQLKGDRDQEFRLAHEYVETLKNYYRQAAQKGDAKTKRAIASALYYGIPGSFKAVFVASKKDKVEVSWGLLEEREQPKQTYLCEQKTQAYLAEVNNLRNIAKQALAYYHEDKEASLPYYKRLFSIYPPAPGRKPIEEAWEAADTEENWGLVKEIEQEIDSLPEWRQKKFLEKRKAAENGGMEEQVALIETALQIKLASIHAEKDEFIEEIKPQTKQAMQRLSKYKKDPCAIPFDQELHGYADGLFFSVSEYVDGRIKLIFYDGNMKDKEYILF